MFGAYDLVVILALVLGYFVGRAKGFVWQLSGIATLALGYVAASALWRPVAAAFPGDWPADLRSFAAWAAIYAVVSIGVYLVSLKLEKRIRELEFEELDRRFGGALGAVKAGLLVLVCSLVAVAVSAKARDAIRVSPSGRVLARAGVALRFLLPDRVGDAMGECLKDMEPNPVAEPTPARPVTGPTTPGPRPSVRPKPVTPVESAPVPVKPAPARPTPEPESSEMPKEDPNAGDGEDTPARPGTSREAKPDPPEKDDPLAPPRRKTPEPARDPLAPR